MGSVRDPGRAAMEAAELARARAASQQTANRRKARRAREARLRGDSAARKALAADFGPVNDLERVRAQR